MLVRCTSAIATTILVMIVAVSGVFAQDPSNTGGEQKPAANNNGAVPSGSAPSVAPAAVGIPTISRGMELYHQGKLEDAAAEFKRVIDAGVSTPAGYAGLARVRLREEKVDEAAEAAAKGVELGPNLASTHIALGQVYIRQGRIEEAMEQFRKLVTANTSDPLAYYGLARVFHLASYHKKESLLLNRAHELDPHDPEIEAAWLRSQGWEARIKVLQARLADSSLDAENRKSLEEKLKEYKKYEAQPPSPCTMNTKSGSTETTLIRIIDGAKQVQGYGLGVKVNGVPSTLLVDTGASGITISQRIAEKAGVQNITEREFEGIGDKQSVGGYFGYAKTLQVGDFEFHDCAVDVLPKSMDENSDGLLGANVFAHFLVDLDFPNLKLRISPLPVDPAVGAEKASLDSSTEMIAEPRDRYLSPDMKDFFMIYLSGHNLMIPTKLNDLSPFLFILDTGAQDTLVSLAAATRLGKVGTIDNAEFGGIAGKVKKVYRTKEVRLQFANFRQLMPSMYALDLGYLSDRVGLEISGFLGFEMLRMLDIKIDYRDGLLSLKFDPKRFYTDVNQQSYTH
jgi:tetratricopeptide (TPR) repeat protein